MVLLVEDLASGTSEQTNEQTNMTLSVEINN